MKNRIIGIVMIIILLPGCSNERQSMELLSTYVEIRDGVDGDIVYGEVTGELVTHTTLSYEFELKNISNNTIGGKTIEKGIDIKIIPNDKLKQVSEEVMRINFYDEIISRNGFFQGTQTGRSIVSNLLPNTEGKYSIHYYLGANEKNHIYKVVPSPDKLDEVEKYAADATLVVLVNEKEIARFDLRK